MRGYSSVAEHSTADREVTGSTPVVPLELLNYVLSPHLAGVDLSRLIKRACQFIAFQNSGVLCQIVANLTLAVIMERMMMVVNP